jgi:hypothetical protein
MADVPFKSQYWLDSEAGTLTDYSSQIVTWAGPDMSKTLITPTGTNDDDEQAQHLGMRSYTISITGWLLNTSTGSLWTNLQTYRDTSIEASKTFQKKQGTLGKCYETGECVLESLTPPPGDNAGTGLIFSATLRVDNGVTATSVSAA